MQRDDQASGDAKVEVKTEVKGEVKTEVKGDMKVEVKGGAKGDGQTQKDEVRIGT